MFDQHQLDAVVGSSRGAAVARNVTRSVAKLVLLCPAGRQDEATPTVLDGTVILPARADDRMPLGNGEKRFRRRRLPASALFEVGSDQGLADAKLLARLLRMCEWHRSGSR